MSYRKYRNKPTEVDGIRFDSAAESRRYQELKLLEQAGKIAQLQLQPEFVLQEAYINGDGKKVKPLIYIADFQYWDFEYERRVIEDVKRPATATAVYKLKKKLFECKYQPKTITEVDA